MRRCSTASEPAVAVSLCGQRRPSPGASPGLRPASAEGLRSMFLGAGCVLCPRTRALKMRHVCFVGSNCLENREVRLRR